jgi:site-specific DNA-methyltransferase (adenine-specific)
MSNSKILVGDVSVMLGTLEDASVDCVMTSPPYWGLRNYQVDNQIGLEPTPAEYVATMVKVFGEVARVLKPSGTVWLNLGDSYAGTHTTYQGKQRKWQHGDYPGRQEVGQPKHGLKPKNLCGIPWRVAFGLQDDGWYLRQEIIWHKPNPMPESVRDRCTKAHESIFLLAHPDSGGKYYYDADAVREREVKGASSSRFDTGKTFHRDGGDRTQQGYRETTGRNKRSVWTMTTKPYSQAHFATFPPELPRTCILAGCPEGGTVLDPFAGAGTTLLVANQLQRHAIGIELNPEYAAMAKDRIYGEAPLLNQVSVV